MLEWPDHMPGLWQPPRPQMQNSSRNPAAIKAANCRDSSNPSLTGSINGAATSGLSEGVGEELLHGRVVEEYAAKYSNVPEVVAAPEIIKHARAPPLGDLAGIYESAG